MKKLLTFALAALSLGVNAQTKTKAKPAPKPVVQTATINFTVKGNLGSGLFLHELKNGEGVSLGFKRPDANGKLSFTVNPKKEGVFFFKRAGAAHGTSFDNVIYLKAGDQKNVEVTDSGIVYKNVKIEKPNIETTTLQAWVNAMNEYSHSVAAKPSVGRTKYAQFEKFAASFLKSNQTANPYFNTWLNDKVTIDLKYLRAGNFFGLGRLNGSCDSSLSAQEFYKPLLDKNTINDVRLLRSEHGMELLDFVFGYWKFNEVKNQQKVVDNFFSAENGAKISNDAVKVAFLMHKIPGIKEYENFVKYVEPYKSAFVTPEQKEAYNKVYNNLGPYAKGRPGYNFELKDVNDKTYTLAGFKGKIVVIDVWAMWCAPCLAEKPIMEKIAEGYHDRNDIIFIGMSVDGHDKTQIWKDFVKKRGFKSIELITQFDESLFKFYKISAIPRFLIFDREGKVVTVDAPRPSTPQFKKLIDETLAAK
ncbi:TlpA family protein disulfide reductase [Solitalea sp. MAHUQ-68]|uniref:TlpA family protein disulfide reductase n=1 Tax=Solitalea agri TaxID=2953739 RepID=A0A9X2F4U9_9SPHI|nr:TlpA disulfide reductase family protein [Solitalea agri]MCO4291888.1 TlpA family protein disulfide reductase [Solitalea agri]